CSAAPGRTHRCRQPRRSARGVGASSAGRPPPDHRRMEGLAHVPGARASSRGQDVMSMRSSIALVVLSLTACGNDYTSTDLAVDLHGPEEDATVSHDLGLSGDAGGCTTSVPATQLTEQLCTDLTMQW